MTHESILPNWSPKGSRFTPSCHAWHSTPALSWIFSCSERAPKKTDLTGWSCAAVVITTKTAETQSVSESLTDAEDALPNKRVNMKCWACMCEHQSLQMRSCLSFLRNRICTDSHSCVNILQLSWPSCCFFVQSDQMVTLHLLPVTCFIEGALGTQMHQESYLKNRIFSVKPPACTENMYARVFIPAVKLYKHI